MSEVTIEFLSGGFVKIEKRGKAVIHQIVLKKNGWLRICSVKDAIEAFIGESKKKKRDDHVGEEHNYDSDVEGPPRKRQRREIDNVNTSDNARSRSSIQHLKEGIILQVNSLGESVKFNVDMFNNKPYIHIRAWNSDNKPLKQGVTMGVSEWEHIKHYMSGSVLVDICKEAFQNIVEEKVKYGKTEDCPGCAVSHPSQKQHTCLEVVCSEDEVRCMVQKMNPWDVIFEMAKICKERAIILKDPEPLIDICKHLICENIVFTVYEKIMG